MSKLFEVQRVMVANRPRWVPADESCVDLAHLNVDGYSEQLARHTLFAVIDAMMPGVYRLELDLDEARQAAFAKIDARSRQLIDAGVSFEGHVFSMSLEAQIRYATMLQLADALEYDLSINSRDDRSALHLVNGNHTRAFCATAIQHIRSIVDSGTVQKDWVRATTDIGALLSYTDPR